MTATGYLDIKKIVIGRRFLEQAYRHMRAAGAKGLEGVALFVGRESPGTIAITHTIVPRQRSLNLEEGLLYSVSGEELHSINVWLYENGLCLVAQIHSHPGAAYHSGMDDAYPIVATVGGLSIVVPDFASGSIALENWAVYRLSLDNEWTELDLQEKRALFQITD